MTETRPGPSGSPPTGSSSPPPWPGSASCSRQHAQARPRPAEDRLGGLAAAGGPTRRPAARRRRRWWRWPQRTGLSRFEQDVLLLCAATELDPSIRGAVRGRARSTRRMAYPTFALALTVLPGPAWEALSPESPLREQRLIEVDRARGESLISSPLRTDERIVNHLKGLDHLDARLRPLLQPAAAADEHLLPASHLRAVAPVAGCLAGGPAAQLVGPDRSSAMLVASAAAARAGVQLFVLPGSVLPASPDEIDELARLWHREWALSPVALCVEIDPAGRDADAAAALVTRLSTPVLVRAREAVPALDGHGLVLDIDPPTMAERHAAWQQHLPSGSAADPGTLAAQFTLDTATIAAAAADPDPWARCRVLTRPHLGGYAQRLQPKAGWADLVLGEQELRLLHGVADQMRNRWRVYQEWGFAETTSRGLGLSVAAVRAERGRQDAGHRGAGPRTGRGPVPHRPVRRGQQVHRGDREEPAAAVRRGRGQRRAAALRRGRRPVRQAHRGQGGARPVRQHPDRLPAAAHGGLPRAGRPVDEHAVGPGPRVLAAAAVHRRVPVPRYRRSAGRSGRWPSRRRSPAPPAWTWTGWPNCPSPAA